MQVSVSSAAASTTTSSASSAASSPVKAGQSMDSQGAAGVTDSFEQVYQHQDASASQGNGSTPESGDSAEMADVLAGQTEPLSSPQAEQLAQWLQTQPDPAQALAQLMRQLGLPQDGLHQGQGGELSQQLTTILAQLRSDSGSSSLGAQTLASPLMAGKSSISASFNAQSGLMSAAQATAYADSLAGAAGEGSTSQAVGLNARNPAGQSAALLESLQQALGMQGVNSQNVNAQGLHSLAQQMMSTTGMQHAAASASTGSSATPDVLTQQLNASVDVSSPEWGKELVDQLRARMAFTKQESVQHAHVRLDPPELGKLEVSIRVEGDKASVHFSAAHPQLREALAANADRLRMDFDGSSLDLVDVSVSSGMQQQSQSQGQSQQGEQRIAANEVQSAGVTIPAYALGSRFESLV